MKDAADPTITHFILSIPHKYPLDQPIDTRDLDRKDHWCRIMEDHGKWYDPSARVFDVKRNKIEGRTRAVMRREWLDEVFTGRAKVEEVGKWGIWYAHIRPSE